MNTTPNNEAAYDRELIARMLDVCGHPMFTLDAYREQARLLRAADNASASAETVSRKPADAEVRAPSYDALLLIAQSVCGALERAGVTDCDDPGEAIDVLREQYEAKIAALSQQPEAKPDARCVVDEDALRDARTIYDIACIRESRDNATREDVEFKAICLRNYNRIAALMEARNVR